MEYDVIDADGHVLEPPDLWEQLYRAQVPGHLPEAADYRRRRRGFADRRRCRDRPRAWQKTALLSAGSGRLARAHGGVKSFRIPYLEGKPGGFDPHARIPDMDAEGIDAAFLYPSLGLFLGATKEPEFSAAVCRAYNRWLADYCKPYPERLFGAAMLPMQSVEDAVDEMVSPRRN